MAVWQFDLDFINDDDSRRLSASKTQLITAELTRRVGRSHRMLGGWDYFGTKDGNRLDVVIDDDGTSEVQARLDARSAGTDEFLAHVCEVAAASQCLFFSNEFGVSLDPDAREIKALLQQSQAWDFALDPSPNGKWATRRPG